MSLYAYVPGAELYRDTHESLLLSICMCFLLSVIICVFSDL